MQFKTIAVNVHFIFIFFSTKTKIFKISNLVQDVRFHGDFFISAIAKLTSMLMIKLM